MGDDTAQARYDEYRDSIGYPRRPLPGNVRHLFEQTTERDAAPDTTRTVERTTESAVTSTSAPVPNSRHTKQRAKRAH